MFRIHFLDVGRGDTIILQFDNGRTYLVDYHEVSGKPSPLDYLVSTLGVKELETVIITHPHRDHFRGIHRVVETLPIRQIWLSPYPHAIQSYKSFERLLVRRRDIRVSYPCSGTTIAEGEDRIRVLAPLANLFRGTHNDVNNASLVLKITIIHPEQDDSTSVLLGADAEITSWQQILIEHGRDIQSDLLKISHHGSQHGTDSEVIAAIRPQYSVISVGANSYGHPDPDTLALIEEHTSQRVLRTDVDGTCVFESDGVNWHPV